MGRAGRALTDWELSRFVLHPRELQRACQQESPVEEARPIDQTTLAEALHQGRHCSARERGCGLREGARRKPGEVTTRAGGTADAVLLFATDEAHLKAAVPTTMKSTGPSTSVWTPETCWLS